MNLSKEPRFSRKRILVALVELVYYLFVIYLLVYFFKKYGKEDGTVFLLLVFYFAYGCFYIFPKIKIEN